MPNDNGTIIKISVPVARSTHIRIQEEADRATIGIGTRARQIFIEYFEMMDAMAEGRLTWADGELAKRR
jgi:hypothetical protein